VKNSKAIVTLVIGDKYLNDWKKLCQINWQKYAEKYGYDIICLDTPLDTSSRAQKRSPAWQKCLILSQEFSNNYERIVWIDSDILINSTLAPCIAEGVPKDKVGVVNEWSSPTPELYAHTVIRRHEYYKLAGFKFIEDSTPDRFYRNYGLPGRLDGVVQTGVMVLSPQYHRQILEKVYFEYEDKGLPQWNYEMRPLSWELLEANSVHWIDPRFNMIWSDYMHLHYPFLLEKSNSRFFNRVSRKLQKVALSIGIETNKKLYINTAFLNSFFLHFAGRSSDIELVNTNMTSWRDL
jgi:hypothetical protein